MIRFSTDTSSLILLEKCSLLSRLKPYYRLFISTIIRDEWMRGSLLLTPQLPVILIKEYYSDPLPPLTSADSSVIHLFHAQNCNAVLSDDKEILQYCRINNLSYYCSLSLVAFQVQQGFITPIQAQRDMQVLIRVGHYSGRIINTALNLAGLQTTS